MGGGPSSAWMRWRRSREGIALLRRIFDFVGPSLKGWTENFSTAAIGALSGFTDRTKAVFTMNTSAAVLGLGSCRRPAETDFRLVRLIDLELQGLVERVGGGRFLLARRRVVT